MKLRLAFSEQANCYCGLHPGDAAKLFLGASRHFCRALRVEAKVEVFLGFRGDQSLTAGVLELSKPFAECLGLEEGPVEVQATTAPLAKTVLVQPNSVDDFEVVELQAEFIEEHLLNQVSVLMPGMAFPVWVHGQLAAKLCLDAKDENQSPCFMLTRDTDLAIETRKRADRVAIKPDAHERCEHLRVFNLDEELDLPRGIVHAQDLDAFAAGLSTCLAWLQATSSQLLRLEPGEVPRGHIILGASFAKHVGVPRFGLAKLRRCVELPAYVPRVELVPAVAGDFEDMGWLRRRFEALVKLHKEIDLADGAVLQLRGEAQGEELKSMVETSASGSEVDLYDGLSDIDDIYQRSTEPAICLDADCGVYEVDLGLDFDPYPLPSSPKEKCRKAPERLLVHVRLHVGAARELRCGPPPFMRLSHAALLAGECSVSVALERAAEPAEREALELLWAMAPRGPPEDWRGVVQLVEPLGASAMDGMPLFSEARRELRGLVEAALGSGPRPGIVAITGATGCGKSRLAQRLLGELEGVLPLQVVCSKLGQPSKKFKTVQDWLRGLLSFACWYSPCALLLDDFGALCPDVEPGAPNLSITEERSAILSELLLDLLPEVRSSGARVALLATMPDDAAVHRMLWTWPALEHKVAIRQPQLKERPEMLMSLLREKVEEGWEVEQALLAEGALDDWGGRVDGFSVGDLCSLVERACVEATVSASAGRLWGDAQWSEPQRLVMEHLEKACEGFTPAAMADQSFFTSEVRLKDIGGLQNAKQELMDMLTMPTRYAVLLDRAPVRTRKGLMLVGPPGCGKSMLVQAAACETKGLLRFLSVKGPELLSKYIGESEAGVRKVFERAAAAAPSVIFFDEIEALAPKRGADSTGVTDRVVNQMLCYLDGVEDRGRVFVVAASGRPDMVDPALMRPGRFDKICYLGLPSEEEKLEICELMARKNHLSGDDFADPTTALRKLVSRMPRLFTSADVGALFSSAKIEAVNEGLRSKSEPKMTMSHLYAALASAKASVSESDERRYDRIFAPYCGGGGARGGPEEEATAVKVALA